MLTAVLEILEYFGLCINILCILHLQNFTSYDSKQKPVSEEHADAPVAVLFSGGLDSMILAALVDECLQPHCKPVVSAN